MADRHERDDAERLEAQLSLTSEPPETLDERIRLRRERGDRVLLPVPQHATHRPRWRAAMLPAALAAAALLMVVAVHEWRQRSTEDVTTRVAVGDSVGTRPETTLVADSGTPPVRPAPGGEGQLPAVDIVSTFDGRGFPAGTLFATTMDAMQTASVDSAARIANSVERVDVVVRNAEEGVAAAPAARALADSVVTALEARGVPPASIRLLRGAAAAGEPRLQAGEVRILVRERRTNNPE